MTTLLGTFPSTSSSSVIDTTLYPPGNPQASDVNKLPKLKHYVDSIRSRGTADGFNTVLGSFLVLSDLAATVKHREMECSNGLMYPIASEHPGNLGSGPPDFTMTLNIAQPNAPFFDIILTCPRPLPVLLQLLSVATKRGNNIIQPQDFLPSELLILLPSNKIIEISIPGTGGCAYGNAALFVQVPVLNTCKCEDSALLQNKQINIYKEGYHTHYTNNAVDPDISLSAGN
ncbi:hypothetical protein B0H14DRAFT_2575583 [Mycena olivaceomarginata]|nr:hypothetical protein B0H14DRAFT_2575583 [Mycena olivaceomarginata]